ncbi:hypothetical protein BpHYR1_020813 [Brachionus plicatilis]|uniref:Uncharacterized protein n=1 Tax=Brachionus plicatilis TaxID=10195 RepID=A0A3M7PT40_BRAPC|nr:hypothetical protein BpHYR1_020813 [Brachionus plicatilis]
MKKIYYLQLLVKSNCMSLEKFGVLLSSPRVDRSDTLDRTYDCHQLSSLNAQRSRCLFLKSKRKDLNLDLRIIWIFSGNT